MPLIIPLFWQLPLSLVSGLLLQYRVVRRDSEKVSRAIRHYVPENVADSLIRQGEAGTPTELIYGVCLATDAEHYTNVSERLSPGDLATLMNDYFRLLSRPIERYDGEVYELSADSMMCLWRAPQADRATRLEACSAALEIDQALKEFNALHEDRQLPTRLGLHAGWVATANLKAGEHYAYSLIGDMANTASRIEGLNRYLGTRILASEPVIEDLDSFLMRCMGSFRLEGKSEPLTIFQILGSKKSMAEESRDLCQRFEQALQVFRTGKWSSAIDAFDVVLSTHPGDGPSEFYRGRCERYLTFPPTTDPAWIIQMEAK